MALPLVVVLRGIGDPQQLSGLKPEGCDVVFFNLCSMTGRYSAEAYARAYEAALPNREIILVGASIGAAIALAMRAPQVRQVIALEPFLRTAHLWPLIQFGRLAALPNGGEEARFWGEALGIYTDRTEERVFEVRTEAPIHVITGSIPITPKGASLPFPSFTSEGDRAALVAHGATFEKVPGGHGGPVENPAALLAAIRRSRIPR